MDKLNICAFTGHRPHRFPFGYNETDPRCLVLKANIENGIKELSGQGVRMFITGMALGVDMWAAESVYRLKDEGYDIKLLCALPCANFDSRWTHDMQQRGHGIIERADRTVTLARTYYPACMLRRDMWMADRADVLLAVLNGSHASKPDRVSGGTAFTVDYALSKEKRVILIDPERLFAEVTR